MKRIAVILLVACGLMSYGQVDRINTVIIDYSNPQKFEIGGISVSGNTFTDSKIVILMSGLSVGQTITLPCDGGYRGFKTRTCTSPPNWDDEDTSGCEELGNYVL